MVGSVDTRIDRYRLAKVARYAAHILTLWGSKAPASRSPAGMWPVIEQHPVRAPYCPSAHDPPRFLPEGFRVSLFSAGEQATKVSSNADGFIEPAFALFEVGSWADAKTVGDRLRSRYAFRGQPDSASPLATHIERAANRNSIPPDRLHDAEREMLYEFDRRVHHYLSGSTLPSHTLDALALIQHHGGPTRLLDFTHSFYVAAFFAVDQAADDAAVWAVDLGKLRDNASGWAGWGAFDQGQHRARNERHEEFCNMCIVRPPDEAFVLDVEPFRTNVRMADQQGLFLFPTRIELSFERNLANAIGTSVPLDPGGHVYSGGVDNVLPSIAKIHLPRDIHDDVIRDLRTMNVTALSLFGGLDGLSRSLDHHLRSAGRAGIVRGQR